MEKINSTAISMLGLFMIFTAGFTGIMVKSTELTEEQIDTIMNNTYTTAEDHELYYSTFEITDINDTHHAIGGTDQLNVGNFNTEAGYYYQIIELSYFLNGSRTSGDWIEYSENFVRFHAFCGDFPAMESSSDQFDVLISENCNVEIGVQDDWSLSNFEQFKEDYNDVFIQLVFQKFPMIHETN